MSKPDTRHLDTAIDLLGGGNGSVKRAKRKAQVELVLYVDAKNGLYSITANGRPLVVDHKIADSDPEMALKARAESIRSAGKTVTTTIF